MGWVRGLPADGGILSLARAIPGWAVMAAVVGSLGLAGCGGDRATPERTLTVFAAASLAEAFQEIGKQFEADHPGVKVVFNLAGSQQLAQQLVQGAGADVFASANSRQMDAAVQSGRVAQSAPTAFTGNKLVVVLPAHNPAGIDALVDLAKPGVKIVLAAKEVPAGQYAMEFLDKAAASSDLGVVFSEGFLANVVSYEPDVRSVLTKVTLGEADAAVVYTTDVASIEEGKATSVEIPDDLNVLASYPIAVVADSRLPKQAQAFVEFVLGPGGQAVLARYGFQPLGS